MGSIENAIIQAMEAWTVMLGIENAGRITRPSIML